MLDGGGPAQIRHTHPAMGEHGILLRAGEDVVSGAGRAEAHAAAAAGDDAGFAVESRFLSEDMKIQIFLVVLQTEPLDHGPLIEREKQSAALVVEHLVIVRHGVLPSVRLFRAACGECGRFYSSNT